MARYGLLGRKLGHSYSPQIHEFLGTVPYALYEREIEDVAAFMEENGLAGMNVTIPYKETVLPWCRELSPRAKAIGSVNTLVPLPGGGYFGDNTDYDGFCALLDGFCAAGKKALVLGSGGSSKTVQAVLCERGAQVIVISRTGENNYENLHRHYDARLIVNTTPVGMFPNNGQAPLDLAPFIQLERVVDLIYNPHKTALLLQAESLDIETRGGLAMLVAQAKRAAEVFTGKALPDDLVANITQILSNRMRNVTLIGMPGCGKSTVGRALAKKCGREFVDLDAVIVDLAGRPIADIFAAEGEDAFRKIETEALAQVSKAGGKVIACGGGIVERAENRALIAQNSICVYIKRNLDKLATGDRPVSQRDGVQALYARRSALYTAWADLEADNNGSFIDAVNAIAERLNL